MLLLFLNFREIMKKNIFSVFLQLELSSIRTRIKSATFSGWLLIVYCFWQFCLLAVYMNYCFFTNHFIRCL